MRKPTTDLGSHFIRGLLEAAEAQQEEEPCQHAPGAWRNCERCRDAEGDLREHEEREEGEREW